MSTHTEYCNCMDCRFNDDVSHYDVSRARFSCKECGDNVNIYGEDYYDGLKKLALNAVRFNHYNCLLMIHVISLRRLSMEDMLFVNWGNIFKVAVEAHKPKLARFVLYSLRMHQFATDRRNDADKQKVLKLQSWMLELLIDSKYHDLIVDAIDTRYYSFSEDVIAESDGLYAKCASEGATKLICYMLAHKVVPSDFDKNNACTYAATSGHLDCLHLLRSANFEWDTFTSREAYINGNIACLLYLLENGCPWKSINGKSREDIIKLYTLT